MADAAQTTDLSASSGKILTVMLDRLFAAIAGGPSLNCRPHNSRQRLEWNTLAGFKDLHPGIAFRELLSDKATTRLVGRIKAPPQSIQDRDSDSPELRAHRREYATQQQLISKLRILVDEARTYEEDTGVHVLNIGFPLLRLSPGAGGRRGAIGRRILAPVAFIPVSLSVQGGAMPAVEISCQSDEVDRVVANEALLAWLEQQTGKTAIELFTDEEGSNPWREIAEIVRHVAAALDIQPPDLFDSESLPELFEFQSIPKSEDAGEGVEIVPGAVIGLYPASKQGLIRDTKAMLKSGISEGPVRRFLTATAAFDRAVPPNRSAVPAPSPQANMSINAARLVAPADPCQASAVSKARTEDSLVIHGPPGTGKSQTITNIIGDHLARGQRILFVCDKRTALDVVANRLQAIGLGDLCALIHDPQRDQKNLYMSIREQLDGLAEKRPRDGLERQIERLDAEMVNIYKGLSDFRDLLNTRDAEGICLHDLVGKVLALTGRAAACPVDIPNILGVSPDVLESMAVEIREALSRGIEVQYADNPWIDAAGLSLGQYLAVSGDRVRQRMETICTAARAADATARPDIAPFSASLSLVDQAAARTTLADDLETIYSLPRPDVRRYWALRPKEECASAGRVLAETAPALAKASEGALDAELLMTIRANPPGVAQLARAIGSLESYLASTKSFLGFLAFGKRKGAETVLSPLGLPITPSAAERAREFFFRLRALLVVRSALDGMTAEGRNAMTSPGVPDRESTLAEANTVAAVVRTLVRAYDNPLLAPVSQGIAPALARESADTALITGLRASVTRAVALESLETAVSDSGLIDPKWAGLQTASWRGGAMASTTSESLRTRLPSLESALRLREGVAGLHSEIRPQVLRLLEAGVADEPGLMALRLACTCGRVAALIEASPKLHATDAKRVQAMFERWRELEAQRRVAVKDFVQSQWLTRQQERLVVGTGSRLNSDGAKVRQRLITRGARALRLRQVLLLGRETAGGDPILDLRPVWMASPETVSQIFPRETIFDVVIFDEASQCRLEDALPVLTRARRVVIAGDPKQLPPTRFFESAAAGSDEDPIATDEQLFEAQQSQVEDLLGAALNLALAESYLDVHYRSQNADLIAFSNEYFYSKRLQAIPGHPRNRTRVPPLNLCRADGVYEDRQNEREAEHVVRIVRDLLRRAEPPSIGIACFNLSQRDLIVEKLDDAAQADAQFGAKLAAARSRRTAGAPDGLFVKNLENVQGDERDHIIISTTYGPDASGRFHRRFGPLLQPGGGRRLNVLITRARQEIHLVTSIPREAYIGLPEVPVGATPGGGWLLLSYLRYAEALGDAYEHSGEVVEDSVSRPLGMTERIVRESAAPSAIAMELGTVLEREHGTGSVIHWGNDGFCVDIALRHPNRPLDVTCGILCDFARYAPGQDAIEWDIFRTGILESQGWRLERLWSPGIFRDPKGCLQAVLAVAERIGREEAQADAIRVIPLSPPQDATDQPGDDVPEL